MSTFETFDGLTLHYDTQGSGAPVVLLHSFGFDARLWMDSPLVPALVESGRRTIAPDARGHGRSDKPHVTGRYGVDAMARDVISLLDHLAVDAVDLVSYSMGSFVALRLLQIDPRVRLAVLGGVGAAALKPHLFGPADIPGRDDVDAVRDLVTSLAPHLTRRVEAGEADARALLEVLRGGFSPRDKDFAVVTASVLLISGTDDDDPSPLAAALPHAQVHLVDGDHASAMEHPDFTSTIVEFLQGPTSRRA